MLKLTANNSPLILLNATAFNLVLKSPLAGENAGSYVFSCTVAYEGNAIHFGWPARLTRMEVLTTTATAQIIYNGIHTQKGEWKARTSTTKTINLEMVIGMGHFNTLVDGHKLAEYFDDETTHVDIAAHINSQVTKVYPEVNHQFPCILNTAFYEGVTYGFSGVINDYKDSFLSDYGHHNNIVPQLYLLYIVKQLFQIQGYKPVGNVLKDSTLLKTLLYNNFAIDKLESVYFYGEAINDIVLTTSVIKWDTNIVDPQSNYTALTGKYRVTSSGTYKIDLNITCKLHDEGDQYDRIGFLIIEILYNDIVVHRHTQVAHTPLVLVTVALTHNHTVLPSDINKDFTTKCYYIDDLEAKYASYIDEGDITIVNSTSPEVNSFGDTINYRNHVPDMEVKSFLPAFYSNKKILPFFDHDKKTVELVFLSDLLSINSITDMSEGLVKNTLKHHGNDYTGLTFKFDWQGPDALIENNFIEPDNVKDTVATYPDLPTTKIVGDIYFITALNAWYKYEYIEPENEEDPGTYKWIGIADKHPDVVYDDGNTPILGSIPPMLMRCHEDPENYFMRNMASIEAKGTSEAFAIENSFPLRLMIYNGIKDGVPFVEAQATLDYPMASTLKYQTDGTVILPFNYTWEDLIKQYWIPIIAWYKRRLPIDFNNLVEPEFIKTFDFQDKFFFQKTLVLYEEVVIKIKNKVFGPGKFKGWG
ncbi:MAG: hypothetical protein QM503_03770 [Bacteroidota bacterium]